MTDPTSEASPRSPLRHALAELHPAYFALVMATGIVSIATELLGWHSFALTLLALNVVFYLTLWALTLIRLLRFPGKVVEDFLHHGRCVGFLTMVAGTNVLGGQFVLVWRSLPIATGLWILGLVLWAALTYGIFTVLTVKKVKPTIDVGINGGWLVAVVAAQSVSVLGSQLAGQFGGFEEPTRFLALVMWLGGGMLYIWIIALILYRYMFFTLEPSDLAPPYWINMGAMAISTLAGTLLIEHTQGSAVLEGILPFTKGLTLFFWSTATWWIPMLVILGIWRHGVRRFPLRYDPLYWGAVFPLGMYTACTYRLAGTVDAPYLLPLAGSFVWVAVAAWTLTALGMGGRLVGLLKATRAT